MFEYLSLLRANDGQVGKVTAYILQSTIRVRFPIRMHGISLLHHGKCGCQALLVFLIMRNVGLLCGEDGRSKMLTTHLRPVPKLRILTS